MEKRPLNISIFTKGDPSRRGIIFVHGFPYDHFMWDKVIDELSSSYFCVSYDIRGLGKSPAGDGQFTIEMFVDDLYAVMEEEGLDKPVLCGLSMGGYISLRALERNSEKFSAVILCDTKSEADQNEAKLKRAQGIKIINQKGLASFVNEFIPSCFAEESIKKLGREYEEVLNRSLDFDPVGAKGCLLAMAARTDTTNALSKFNMPVLVICGEKDTLSPPAVMKEMSSKIPGSEFILVPGSGHMTPIENPRAVISAMKDFFKKNNIK